MTIHEVNAALQKYLTLRGQPGMGPEAYVAQQEWLGLLQKMPKKARKTKDKLLTRFEAITNEELAALPTKRKATEAERKAAMKRASQRIARLMHEAFEEKATEAYKGGLAEAGKELGVGVIAYSGPHKKAVETLANGEALAESFAGFSDQAAEKFNAIVTEAYESGEVNVGAITSAMVREVGWQLRPRLETIAHTETWKVWMEAWRNGCIQVEEERGEKFIYTFGSVSDKRTCAICNEIMEATARGVPMEELVAIIVRISKEHMGEGWDPQRDTTMPVPHPHCRHRAWRKVGAPRVSKSLTGASVSTALTELRLALKAPKPYSTNLYGLNIVVEYPQGSIRTGKGPDGPWARRMVHDYGRIKGTSGADHEAVDVFIGPDLDSDKVFVVNQLDAEGDFDEHKAMLGFKTEAAARAGYLAHYPDGWKCGPIKEMSVEEFKEWVRSPAAKRLAKARVYVGGPSDVPQGKRLEVGPRGGFYYESGQATTPKDPIAHAVRHLPQQLQLGVMAALKRFPPILTNNLTFYYAPDEQRTTHHLGHITLGSDLRPGIDYTSSDLDGRSVGTPALAAKYHPDVVVDNPSAYLTEQTITHELGHVVHHALDEADRAKLDGLVDKYAKHLNTKAVGRYASYFADREAEEGRELPLFRRRLREERFAELVRLKVLRPDLYAKVPKQLQSALDQAWEGVGQLRKEWTGPHRGPRGGTFWLDNQTGEARYQAAKPGHRSTQATAQAVQSQAQVDEHVAWMMQQAARPLHYPHLYKVWQDFATTIDELESGIEHLKAKELAGELTPEATAQAKAQLEAGINALGDLLNARMEEAKASGKWSHFAPVPTGQYECWREGEAVALPIAAVQNVPPEHQADCLEYYMGMPHVPPRSSGRRLELGDCYNAEVSDDQKWQVPRTNAMWQEKVRQYQERFWMHSAHAELEGKRMELHEFVATTLQQAEVKERFEAEVAGLEAAWKDDAQVPQLVETYKQKVMVGVKHWLDNAHVNMRVESAALFAILRDGRFKNQHEVYESRGTLNPNMRLAAEEQMFDVSAKMPINTLPIYGYMASDDDRGFDVRHYGSVRIVFKPHIKDRATFTSSDSLATVGWNVNPRVAPAPVNAPEPTALAMEPHYEANLLEPGAWLEHTPYIEAQIHGGLKVEDIAEVHFRKDRGLGDVDAESKLLMRLLEHRGIPYKVVA